MINIHKKLLEICTYHSDDGTSGYLLSDDQFRKIGELIDQAVKEDRKKLTEYLKDKRPAFLEPKKAQGFNLAILLLNEYMKG